MTSLPRCRSRILFAAVFSILAPAGARWVAAAEPPGAEPRSSDREPKATRTLKPGDTSSPPDAFAYNRLLGRGVNLGNALEAPREGEWGVTLEERYFEDIQKAGFDSVRIPIRWSAHALATAPYTIDVDFFRRIDWALAQAAKRGLTAIVNMHHYEEIFADPAAHRERFLALWQQIAEHYKDTSDRVFFEPLNEPHEKLDAPIWNRLAADALAVIRKSNPKRMVIIGPVMWNSIDELKSLELPKDPWLIATVHYYQPFHFTHQGAHWMPDAGQWLGTQWTGSDAERQAVERDLDKAATWGKEHERPIFLGEFGSYEKAPAESRDRWTQFVRQAAEQRHFSWSYWEFCSGFGVYDSPKHHWHEPLLKALIPPAD